MRYEISRQGMATEGSNKPSMVESAQEIPEGYIKDYISDVLVKDTPEEREAVQVFSQKLVDDFGYPKSVIQTRPQFRVKQSPSGKELYPTDIAVFETDRKSYDEVFMIVECKRKNRQDGEKQLHIYMNLCPAKIGVWYNGADHLYLRKIIQSDGTVKWKELPTIPRYGQKLEDIGNLKRKDLKIPTNLKAIFKDIRNHLAGMTTGITRDEPLAKEIINVLFCKIYDEVNTGGEEFVGFVVNEDEKPTSVRKKIRQMFNEKVKAEYNDVFDSSDSITLDAESLTYVVGELQNYAITEAEREAVGDAFEVFIGPALRGPEGQFFTPRNVVRMMVDVLDPTPKELILDPACGSGGFLIVALEKIWKKVDDEGKAKGLKPEQIWKNKRDVASRYFRGLDKDAFLTKVTKAYMAIVGDGRGGVFCENSLAPPSTWETKTRDKIELDSFDVIITNPPFGSKIQVRGSNILNQYDLGFMWRKDDNNWIRQSELEESRPPQLLFIERCYQFLRDGGRLAIILPESIFGMPKYNYIVKWLMKNTTITGIVSMPEELFQPHTHAKTCVVFLKKEKPKKDYPIHMAIAKWCGHDSRGNPTLRRMSDGKLLLLDDVPEITKSLLKMNIWK
jgi:type I restriction enzyme M protein